MTPIDSAIKLLKKRKEEASKVDTATTGLLTWLIFTSTLTVPLKNILC